MAVAGSGDQSVASEEIEFYSMKTAEAGIHPIGIFFIVAFFKMLIYVFFVDWEEIIALIAGMVEPCEAVAIKLPPEQA